VCAVLTGLPPETSLAALQEYLTAVPYTPGL